MKKGINSANPNWREVEVTLFEQGKAAIEQFAVEHPTLICSFFAIIADPLSGEFAFCFDTPQNAYHQAMKQELYILGDRQSSSKRSESWRYAGSLSAYLLEYSSTEADEIGYITHFHLLLQRTLDCAQ